MRSFLEAIVFVQYKTQVEVLVISADDQYPCKRQRLPFGGQSPRHEAGTKR